MKILIKNGTIVNADGERKANVLIEGEKITQITNAEPSADRVIDASDKLVFPGLIDMHVHFRDPGFTHKEDVLTGSKAAAAGGVTSCCPMANTRPVNDSPIITRDMVARARELGVCDIFPVGAITSGFGGEKLTNMGAMKEAGCRFFSDDGLPVVSSDVMRAALEYAKFHGSFISSHSQDCTLGGKGVMNEGAVSMKLGLAGMPREQEEIMIARDILLAKLTGAHMHIAHVSSAWSLKLIELAKKEGVNVTCEVAPHHFTFSEEDVGAYDANFKMSPPLRTRGDVEAMKEGLKSGLIDVVATDHAPHAADEKKADFAKAPFGIIGLQTLVPLTLALVREGVITLSDMARVCSARPAQLMGLDDRGVIAEGKLADVAIIDSNLKYVFDGRVNQSKAANTPLWGKELTGAAVVTIKSGRVVWEFPR